MNFMKTFWAALLAFIVANILIVIISIMFFAGIAAMFGGAAAPSVETNSVLHLDLSRGIADSPSDNPVNMGFSGVTIDNSNTIFGILNAVEHAAVDSNIKGIYINLKGGGVNITNAEELRAALIEFKKSGKFIISYAEGYSQSGYYLCSVADRVYLNPHGGVTWQGLSSSVMFYKGLLDKLGVEPQIMRMGTFKAAVEPFMLDKMSPENRLQMSTLLETMWGTVLHDVSVSRGIDSAVLSNYATDLSASSSARAFEYGFVDNLIYEDQVMEILARLSKRDLTIAQSESEVVRASTLDALMSSDVDKIAVVEGVAMTEVDGEMAMTKEIAKEEEMMDATAGAVDMSEMDAPKFIGLSDYIYATAQYSQHKSKNKIAIVYVDGSIIDGKSDRGSAGGESVAKRLAEVRKDKSIKALVLRVNSPGGSAMASEIMWRELELIRVSKPVIVSMGGMAASGGYYVSCPADVILANRTTLTGSIGVFGLLFNVSKGLKDKLGVVVDVVRTNPSADVMSMYRSVTPRERGVIMEGVEKVYETFIGHVADGRNMTTEAVDKIGGGRIWSGVSSKEIGLIDDFGGFKDAIALAADRAGVADDFQVRQIVDKPKGLLEILQPFLDMEGMKMEGELGDMMMHYKAVQEMVTEQGVQARLPYIIEIQ